MNHRMQLQRLFTRDTTIASPVASRACALALLSLCMMAPEALHHGAAKAQAVKATVVGSVRDKSGAAVSDATITLRERATGLSFTTKTNASGNYVFPDLSPGDWDVIAEHDGFKRSERDEVAVIVDTTSRVDLTVEVGSTTESVTVTSDAPVLQTDRADVSASFEAKQVADLPLDGGRNPQAVQSLLPGVGQPQYIHTSFANPLNGQAFHVNGQAVFASSVQLEGIDDNERSGVLPVVYIPPAAAIQTMEFTLGDYDAEFGRALGSVTNITLKSGTNHFHGSAYEDNEISALAAKNYFAPGAKPRVVNNYYGGTLGGPIWRDRTFFFADLLRYADHAQLFNLESIPSLAARTGNYAGSPFIVYDPATGDATGANRKQISCNGVLNVICPSRFNPISVALLNLLPAPNAGAPGAESQNFSENTNSTNDNQTYDIKIDQKIHFDTLNLRYSHADAKLYSQPLFGLIGGPAGSGSSAGNTGSVNFVLWNAAAEYVHTFTPSLVGEFRFGVSHFLNDTHQSDFGSNYASTLGLNTAPNSIYNQGMPEIKLSGWTAPTFGYYQSYPAHHSETNITMVNNWTKTLGNHIIKWGGEAQRLRDDQISSLQYDTRGAYSFADGQTEIKGQSAATAGLPNAMAAFLLDVPNEFTQQTVLGNQSWRQTVYFGFVQDQWNALPKLTLTLGLRWELYPSPTPNKPGGFANYDPSTNSLTVAGIGGNPSNMGVQTKYDDFAPRFGMAYRADDKTVVRGGFGISYAPWTDNRYGYTNYPVQQNIDLKAANSYVSSTLPTGPALTFQAGIPPIVPAAIPANGIVTNANITSSYSVFNKGYVAPYIMAYNLTVQRALPHDISIDVAYVGNVGRQLPISYNLNAGMVLGAGTAGQPEFSATGPTPGRTASTTYFYKTAASNYNSLQARATRRFKNGLSLTTSYAWQKAMGMTSPNGSVPSPQFYIEWNRNYAALAYNQKQTATASIIYELPFGHGKPFLTSRIASLIAGGWQLSSILQARAGTPLTFLGSTTILNTPGAVQPLNQVAPFKKLYGHTTGNPWFDTSSFQQPTGIAFGNTGINIHNGPGSFDLSSSLFREFKVREIGSVRLRMDAFHALNNPQFGNPDTTYSSSSTTWGTVTSASGSRVLQLAAEIIF